MANRLFALVWLGTLALIAGCARHAEAPPPLVTQVSGTIEIDGLGDAVRIVRDRWGIPHIYARSRDDLFLAQGLVQAQDRLFQMDLWRRSVQGRLSEVLGPNFIERDAMTRRVQYRGSFDAEWNAYGPDTRAIATAFVRGINAWVALARERPPEAFVLAGWKPDVWSPADVLNRTDAFLASGDAVDEIRRAGLSDVIAEAVRRVGTPPFFSGLAAQVRLKTNATTEIRKPDAPSEIRLKPDATYVTVSRGGVLSFSESTGRFAHPAERYVVHLNAPGWNVIGATKPWLPGVSVGHNERIAWGNAATILDTQDVYADPSAALQRTIAKDAIAVKGRKNPFEFDVEQTPHGVVIASDREHDRVFTLRWSGMEPGGAAELGALALDRAAAWDDFRAALAAWRMPARRIVYADADGNIGFQDAALVPIRRSREWAGWTALDDLPHAYNPRANTIAVRNPQPAGSRASADVLFGHVLAITTAARDRFNVGPLPRPIEDAPVRALFDPRAWDRSQIVVAPGQSEAPDSPHFADLARAWSHGELVPLAFSDAAVQANAESTLTLVPRAK